MSFLAFLQLDVARVHEGGQLALEEMMLMDSLSFIPWVGTVVLRLSSWVWTSELEATFGKLKFMAVMQKVASIV